MSVSYQGDPNNLTWALFDYPAEVHAVPGRFTVGVKPSWPSDHLADASCPCRPIVLWKTAAAPRPMYEHREPRRG